jgi:Fe-Mn family superoxide dismutase
VTNLYLFVEIELMSQHQDETFTTAENNDAVTLNRRDFLQSAGLAAAGIAASSTLVGAAAQAQETTDYPRPPKLAEKPLKPSTLNTEGISRRTHEEHYKLYQGYVRKSNELFEGISKVTRDPAKANQIYSELREMKVELSFALGGVKNHELYFDILGGAGSQPQGRLLEEINRSFGSVAAWAADMKATGIAARGWVWTAYDYDLKRLMNYIGDTQNTYPMWNATPIIGLDVYEHAYYLDYGTKRGDYIDAFLKNLNWNAINTRFQLASGPASTLVTLA